MQTKSPKDHKSNFLVLKIIPVPISILGWILAFSVERHFMSFLPPIMEPYIALSSQILAIIICLGGAAFITFKDKESKGFFVVLINLLLIGVINFIAIPNLLRFEKAPWEKQSEPKQNLRAIYEAYKSYHSDHNTYPSGPSIQALGFNFNCVSISGWEPKGSIRYNYNCMNIEAFSPAANDSPCPPGIKTNADEASFTIAACGNLDNDTTVDVWTIDDAKHLRNVVDDVKR